MPRTVRSAALLALGCALAVPLLAVLAYYVAPIRIADAHFLDWFSAHKYTTPDSYRYTTLAEVAKAVTFFAEPIPLLVIVGLGCAYAVARRRALDALAALLVVGGANVTTQVLKHLLAHQRYESFLEHVPDQTTFPSGHVTGAATLVVALVWVGPPARRRALAWAGAAYIFLVGLSVLVLEWHFPSDIFGALAVTGAWTFGVYALYLRWREGLRSGRRAGPFPDQLDDLAHDPVDVEVLGRVDAGDARRP